MWQASANSAILPCLATNGLFMSSVGPVSNADKVIMLWLIPLQSWICCLWFGVSWSVNQGC